MLSSPRTSTRKRSARHLAGCGSDRRRLSCEQLEDRRLLAQFTVTSLDDAGGGTLRQAILDANLVAGADEIIFAQSLNGSSINLSSGELTIDDDVTISASALPQGIILNAQSTSRIFNIDDSVSSQIDVQLDQLTLIGGYTTSGGGAIWSRENLTVTGSTISGNSAFDGGGIYNTLGDLTVTDSTISGNSASRGGGIYSDTDLVGTQTTAIINSTLSGNTAGITGGGLYNFDGLTVIANSTITDNFAPAGYGSGVASFGDNVTETQVVSSIISGNAFDNDVDNVIGAMNSFTSLDFNLIGGGNAAGEFGGPFDQNYVFDPGLLPLANNGGPTLTHALLLSSPAIDSGFNAFGLPHDQRGGPFLRQNIGFEVDVGAFEWQTPYFPLVVNTALDELDDDYNPGDLSLREAINAANGFFGPDVISFEPGIFAAPQTIALTGGQLDITDAVIIEGPGAGRLTIDAQGNSRVFDIGDGDFSSEFDVELLGLTLTGGYAAGALNGGGAIQSRENLTVTGSTISGNSSSPDGDGGGILSSIGNLTVTDSTISGNSAARGGGGIFSIPDPFGAQTTIINSTLSGNSAGGIGGGMFNFDGLTVIANSTITDNFAPAGYGSGVASFGDDATETQVVSSIISGNAHNSDVDNVIGAMNSFTSLDFNLIGGGNAAGEFGGPFDQNYVFDPGLLTLANNGGPTLTHALLLSSPAIDSGFNAFGLPHDQRGAPFLRQNIGFDADVGAFEWQTAYFPLVVDSTLDELDDNYEVGDLSLREAINAANGFFGPDVISFDESGVFASPQVIALTLGELQITDSVIIEAPGANRLTLNALGNSRVLNIDDGVYGSQINVELLGLTLTGGYADPYGGGGAIRSRENLTVTGSTISGNAANGNGGGIYNTLGDLTVTDSTISGNSANHGGGIYSSTDPYFVANQTTIINSTLSGNLAGGIGGGLFNSDGLTVIANSTITDNFAPAGYGSGVASWGDNVTETQVVSSIISGNAFDSDVDNVIGAMNSFTSLDFNLIGGGNAAGEFGGPNDQNFEFNPGLLPLANNGGPTLTHALLPTSPAIDGGGDPLGLALETDQRGAPFARVFNGRIDIGAFELINGDFDGGGYTCSDVDALVAEIVAGTNNTIYDLNSDMLVNHDDLATWLAVAGVANLPSRNPYLFGDATLDGFVDGQDFIAWNSNKFQPIAAWCSGDFNADGFVDGQDFIIWNANKFQTSGVPLALPPVNTHRDILADREQDRVRPTAQEDRTSLRILPTAIASASLQMANRVDAVFATLRQRDESSEERPEADVFDALGDASPINPWVF